MMQQLVAQQVEKQLKLIEPLLADVVLVGGATIGLWLDDPAVGPARPTNDIDLIVAVRNRPAYYQLGDQLRSFGLRETPESEVICRWTHSTGALFDVMPLDATILGFSNQWYEETFTEAQPVSLPGGTIARLATPPFLLATKFAAFHDRGMGDFLASHDMYDIIAMLDGRSSLLKEITDAPASVRSWLADKCTQLAHSGLDDAILNYLPPDTESQKREESIARIVHTIALQ